MELHEGKATPTKSALGKGLASLFPGATGASPAFAQAAPAQTLATDLAEASNRDRHPGISVINVEEIHVNPYQPRRDFDERALEELAASIRSNGIIQPLVVRRDPKGGYELIAGERRLRASKLAGLKQVPIVVRKSTDRESLEMALIENIQRQNLNCVDEALAYFQLMQDFSLTQEEVATRVGKERTTVANHLRLLRLNETLLEDLKRGVLTFGHGKALLALEENELRMKVRAKVLEESLSVRATESLIEEVQLEVQKKAAGGQEKPDRATVTQPNAFSDRLKTISQELTRKWSAKVEVKGSSRRGKITIHYGSREDLDRLLETLQNEKVWQAPQT